MKDINEQEQLFGLTMSNYKIKEMNKKFDIYKNFWRTVRDWRANQENWLTCQWKEFNGQYVNSEVTR